MQINKILSEATKMGASDVHIAVGNPATVRIDGDLVPLGDELITPEDTETFAKYLIGPQKYHSFEENGHIDISYRINEVGSFRINVFQYSGFTGLACRIISDKIPTIQELELPETIEKITHLTSGLIIFTGPTGCGKSTSIASVVEAINKKKKTHIVTIEDPIEYIHHNKMSIITQREVGKDCNSFSDALRAGLRQDPDIIMVGEMRDLETIQIALTAAETGHLVLATLHTRNAHQTIERIIDVFPSTHQQQIRVQLSNSLMAVFAQKLLPRKDKGRVVAVESLMITPAIRNLIRENKVHQLYTFIQTGQRIGMQTMDDYLLCLYRRHTIDKEVMLENAYDKDAILKELN
ncbi:MAG: type IV pilus twitching motility protein PilT [Clostridia bacterium]|nr:type IV pilus twitching motility protein PilT [Clostridia bacterium]